MKEKKEYIIYFISKVNTENKGYFQRLDKVGFISTTHIEMAKVFKNLQTAERKVEHLADIENGYYDFKIIEKK